MAAEYLASRGVDLDALMSKFQSSDEHDLQSEGKFNITQISKILGVRLPKQSPQSLWDVSISGSTISSVEPHEFGGPEIRHLPGVLDGHGGLLTPSLCHPHVHLDKPFLLQDEKYEDLQIIEGGFSEAMHITGEAKKRFEQDDLIRRGSRLIEESIAAGVGAMRAFVEVDEIVEMKCLDAALTLKQKYRDACHIQISAFAQLALFSGEHADKRRQLLCQALANPLVEVLGSTPYVEEDESKLKQNITWTVSKALEQDKFLDYHLDFGLDATPSVWFLIEELKRQNWAARPSKTQVGLGHCTRLTLFTKQEWLHLRDALKGLDVTFVGTPTSDIFMMGRPESAEGGGARVRGTLQIPQMIKEYELQGAISINNVGNAFTPYGSCSPLALATFGVGIYHAGTKQDSEILFETISSRAMHGIGCPSASLDIQQGQVADLLLFNTLGGQHINPTIHSLVHQGTDLHYHHRARGSLDVILHGKKVETQ